MSYSLVTVCVSCPRFGQWKSRQAGFFTFLTCVCHSLEHFLTFCHQVFQARVSHLGYCKCSYAWLLILVFIPFFKKIEHFWKNNYQMSTFFVSLVIASLSGTFWYYHEGAENLIFPFVHVSFLLHRGKKRSSCPGTAKKRYCNCQNFSVVRTNIKQSKTK